MKLKHFLIGAAVFAALVVLWRLDMSRARADLAVLEHAKTEISAENEELEAEAARAKEAAGIAEARAAALKTVAENARGEAAEWKKVAEVRAEAAARLRAEVAPMLEENPRLQEFVLSLEAQIGAKDKQIAALETGLLKLEQAFELRGVAIEEQKTVIAALERRLENEIRLRSLTETAFASFRKDARRSKLKTMLASAGVGLASGLLGQALLRR